MNGCRTVSPLGVPADWLQLMRVPFPLSVQTNLITGPNPSLDASASSPRGGFHSSDSGSHSYSSSSSSSSSAAAVGAATGDVSESEAEESRPFVDGIIQPPVP